LDGLEEFDPMTGENADAKAGGFMNQVTNTFLRLLPDLEYQLRKSEFAKIGITDAETIEKFHLRMRLVALGDPYFTFDKITHELHEVQDYERMPVLEPQQSFLAESLETLVDGSVVLSSFSGLKGTSAGSTPGVLFAKGSNLFVAERVNKIIKSFTRAGQLGGEIKLMSGNSKKGFQHILERHSADEFLDLGKGDLFPKGTTNEQIMAGIQDVYSTGTRVSDPTKAVQTFEKRIKLNGESANYKLIVDQNAGEVVTFYKMGGNY
jgi:hypothetical protein